MLPVTEQWEAWMGAEAQKRCCRVAGGVRIYHKGFFLSVAFFAFLMCNCSINRVSFVIFFHCADFIDCVTDSTVDKTTFKGGLFLKVWLSDTILISTPQQEEDRALPRGS